MKIKITEAHWRKIFKLRDAFIKEATGLDIFKYQQRFSDKIIQVTLENTGETVVTEWTRQSGKTTVVVWTVAFLLLFYNRLAREFGIKTTPQFNVGFFAPQQQQAQSAFNMLREFLRKCNNKGYDFSLDTFNGIEIRMASAKYPPCTVYCMTAAPTSKQESKTLNLIIMDESQDVEDKVFDRAISPMGASTNSPEIWIGVGGYRKCRFLQHIERLPDTNKFIIPYDMVLEERQELYEKTGDEIYLNYQKHIDKRLREIGEESDEFKTQYMLKWILERGQFIVYEELMKLEDDYAIYKEYEKAEPVYAGIDWGKASDSTVMTVINQHGHVVGWFEWNGDDYSSQIEEIAFLVKEKFRSMQVIHCDSTGNQDMAVDILRAKLRSRGIRVNGVHFSPKSKDEMYKNLHRLMSNKYVGGNLIQEAVFRFPKENSIHKEKFIKQMLDLTKEIKQNLWKCQHPDGPGYHDDYCFVEKTKVKTEKGWKLIKNIKVGDLVLTHKNRIKKVLKTYKRKINDEILKISFSSGVCLEVTKNHPFLLDTGEWCKAEHLELFDKIKNLQGSNEIVRVENKVFDGQVYNFEVEDDNSYLTKAGFVHNCDSTALACMAFLPRQASRRSYKPTIA